MSPSILPKVRTDSRQDQNSYALVGFVHALYLGIGQSHFLYVGPSCVVLLWLQSCRPRVI